MSLETPLHWRGCTIPRSLPSECQLGAIGPSIVRPHPNKLQLTPLAVGLDLFHLMTCPVTKR